MRNWILENTNVNIYEYDKLINSNTVNRIGEKKKSDYNYTVSYEKPMTKIDSFTYRKPSKLRCKIFNIQTDGKYYIYKGIKFKILAEHLSDLKRVLYSSKRIGTCVKYGVDICYGLEGSKIVTAMCNNPFIIEEKKFLHTFVTYIQDNKEFAIDPTINIIMEKDIYLKLLKADIVSEIDREKLISDIKYLQNLDIEKKSITVQEYLCFPNDIMESTKKLVKNKSL